MKTTDHPSILLGERIKARRLLKNISELEFALCTGLEVHQVKDIEHGNPRHLTAKIICNIADALSLLPGERINFQKLAVAAIKNEYRGTSQ